MAWIQCQVFEEWFNNRKDTKFLICGRQSLKMYVKLIQTEMNVCTHVCGSRITVSFFKVFLTKENTIGL